MKIFDTKPELFQKTGISIWTDPYIQVNMLNEHLNPDSDGASRNEKSIETIVDFVDKQIKPGGKLLDLGCGPGLYTGRFEKKGYTVTGIDFNKKAIEYAVQHNKNVNYITGDYISDFPHDNYDAIIMIYCDMGTHSDTDRDKLLQNCYASLNNGGKLIFDVFNEKMISDKTESRNWEYNKSGGFWADKEYLLLSQTFHYPDNQAFAEQYNLIVSGKTKHFIVWDRYYKETEIIRLLKNIGLSKVSVTNDLLENNNFTSNNQMFICAEK